MDGVSTVSFPWYKSSPGLCVNTCGDGELTPPHCWRLQLITASCLLGADGRQPRFRATRAPAGPAPHLLVTGGWFSGSAFFPVQIEFESWPSYHLVILDTVLASLGLGFFFVKSW